jgi:tetratricopeptide (TPR) repeat protein
MLMKRASLLIILVITIVLATGCSSGNKKPDPKEEAAKRWNTTRAGVIYSLALSNYESGNFAKARQNIDEASRLAPESAPMRILSAKLHIELGALELAERELATARELDPKNAEAEYLSGVIHQRWRRTESAYDFYMRASEKAPAELAYLLARSEMLVVLGRSDEALALLQQHKGNFENSAAIREAIGHLWIAAGQYRQAADILRQASVLAESDLTIREHLGLALFYAKDYRPAADVLGRLVKNDAYAKRVDLLIALGESQLHINRPRDARASFETALQVDAANERLWLCLAKAAIELNDERRAELSLKKALALKPGDSEANLLMGYLRLKQERTTEALSYFRQAGQDDPVSLCMAGYALEKMGRPRQALEHYRRALQLNPGDELAAQLLAGIDLGE